MSAGPLIFTKSEHRLFPAITGICYAVYRRHVIHKGDNRVTESETTIRRLPNAATAAEPETCPVLIWEEIFDFDEKKMLGFHVRPSGEDSFRAAPETIRLTLHSLTRRFTLPLMFLVEDEWLTRCESVFLGAESAAFWASRNMNPKLVLISPVSRTPAHSASRLIDLAKTLPEAAVKDASGAVSPFPAKRFMVMEPELVREIETDLMKQFQVRSIREIGAMSGIGLIAQDVHSSEQYEKLVELKIRYGAGSFLRLPVSVFENTESGKEKTLKAPAKSSGLPVGTLASPLQYVDAALSGSELEQLFEMDSALPGVCVFEDEQLVGVVTRELLYEKMSGRYGFGLFANRPIRKIMQTEFLAVDESVHVEDAARMAMQRPQKNLYDFITVTKDGDYSGVVTIRDLILHLAISPVPAPIKRTSDMGSIRI